MYKMRKSEKICGRSGKQRTGFTLLELIAVMGIIVVMSLVVVGSYNGMMDAIAKNAGPRALRNALTLCRQHASVDGQRTYLWITGVNKYIMCRKMGVIQKSGWGSLTGDARPPYLRNVTSVEAYWIRDRDSDLGGTTWSSPLTGSDGTDIYKESDNSFYVFDFKDSEMARMLYPPWMDNETGYWIFGIVGMDGNSDRPDHFAAGSEYGVALFMEQALPEGYVFSDDLYQLDASGNFREGDFTFFEPDGSVPSVDGNTLAIGIVEVNNPSRKVVVKIGSGGKITIEDNQ